MTSWGPERNRRNRRLVGVAIGVVATTMMSGCALLDLFPQFDEATGSQLQAFSSCGDLEGYLKTQALCTAGILEGLGSASAYNADGFLSGGISNLAGSPGESVTIDRTLGAGCGCRAVASWRALWKTTSRWASSVLTQKFVT